MKCSMDTCQNEAEQGYSLYQQVKSPTTAFTKVGQLCKSCFEQITGEKPEEQEQWECPACDKTTRRCCNDILCKDCTISHRLGCEYAPKTFKIKYCVECGKATPPYSDAISFQCPICKGALCDNCLIGHENRTHPKQEPEEEVFHCVKCKKKLSADRVVRHNGIVIYCAECYIEVILGHSPWKDEQEYSSFTYNTHYTRTQNAWTCCDCKKQFHQFITKNYAGKNQFCCDACYQKRQQKKTQSESARYEHLFGNFTYSPRFEYGTVDEDVNAEHASEYIRRMYEAIFGKESTAGTSSSNTQQKQQQTKQQSTTHVYIPTTTREAFKMLGIEPTADVAKIKKAYHALALKHHPDKPNGNAEKMKQINIANDLAMQFAGKK